MIPAIAGPGTVLSGITLGQFRDLKVIPAQPDRKGQLVQPDRKEQPDQLDRKGQPELKGRKDQPDPMESRRQLRLARR